MKSITLNKAVVEKGGNIGYRQEGVRATVYFNKNMFTDPANPPASITISVDAPEDAKVFTAPGDVKAGGAKELTPEQKAKQVAAAEKAQTAAIKAWERAAKAAKRAGLPEPARPVFAEAVPA